MRGADAHTDGGGGRISSPFLSRLLWRHVHRSTLPLQTPAASMQKSASTRDVRCQRRRAYTSL